MALAFTQQPGALMPAQSPIIFSVRDNTSIYTASAFQYTADLYMWTGVPNNSGSTPNYTLRKYPNASGSGIFDFSRFLADYTLGNDYNQYYKVIFNYTYKSGSLNITGSNLVAETTGSYNYATYPGYYTAGDRFNVSLNQQTYIYSNPLLTTNNPFPLLTDATDITQSILDITSSGIIYSVSVYKGQLAPATQSWVYTGLYENGSTSTGSVNIFQTSNSLDPNHQLIAWPSTAFLFPISKNNLVSYKISSGSIALNYKIECPTKYPPYVLRFKNKYNGIENLLCNLVTTTQFQGDSKSFRPQMGDWNSTSFFYNESTPQNQKYISDGYEVLTLNTNYLDQKYNKIIEQLLVAPSEDLVLINVFDENSTSNKGIQYPVELITNSLQLKTGVVNKLIQYTFQVRKNNYKLIL